MSAVWLQIRWKSSQLFVISSSNETKSFICFPHCNRLYRMHNVVLFNLLHNINVAVAPLFYEQKTDHRVGVVVDPIVCYFPRAVLVGVIV